LVEKKTAGESKEAGSDGQRYPERVVAISREEKKVKMVCAMYSSKKNAKRKEIPKWALKGLLGDGSGKADLHGQQAPDRV